MQPKNLLLFKEMLRDARGNTHFFFCSVCVPFSVFFCSSCVPFSVSNIYNIRRPEQVSE